MDNRKYVLFLPMGGFNDSLTNIKRTLDYCKRFNRILLLNTKNFFYKIDFSDFFDLNDKVIIYNYNKIKKIINNNLSLYPKNLNYKLSNIMDNTVIFKYSRYAYTSNGVSLALPNKIVAEDVILHVRCGGGSEGYQLFHKLLLKDHIINICKSKLSLINQHPYLCIHVRHTDLTCNYKKLYEDNKAVIHSYNAVYIATDNKLVVDYFKSKNLNVFSFTTFPEDAKNLHGSNIPGNIKIKDLLVDIFIATNSNKILSNSEGGFIYFLRNCFRDKEIIMKKLDAIYF